MDRETYREINEKRYTLLNLNGCVMDAVGALSMEDARKYFAKSFGGKYKIICTEKSEEQNVRL